ncbi:MAG: SPOR domain-containing protein [Polaromonas sp.]|nr:SPOR domain-containing protein [Polaromonas sp.]
MNKQRGGTLLGFIIGALVGLAVALALAVYVTKVPVPFMSKSQSRNADGDAAEAKRNKDWNPNAPLAGKSGAAPPPPAATNPGVTPAAPVPAAPATAVAGSKPSVATLGKNAGPAASADPIGNLATARGEAPAAGGGGIDPFTYFIQAGAYRTPEDAEQQRARLTLLGVQAKVSEREQSGRTVYRVRLGPFERKDDADRAKARLDANSIETALVRVQR